MPPGREKELLDYKALLDRQAYSSAAGELEQAAEQYNTIRRAAARDPQGLAYAVKPSGRRGDGDPGDRLTLPWVEEAMADAKPAANMPEPERYETILSGLDKLEEADKTPETPQLGALNPEAFAKLAAQGHYGGPDADFSHVEAEIRRMAQAPDSCTDADIAALKQVLYPYLDEKDFGSRNYKRAQNDLDLLNQLEKRDSFGAYAAYTINQLGMGAMDGADFVRPLFTPLLDLASGGEYSEAYQALETYLADKPLLSRQLRYGPERHVLRQDLAQETGVRPDVIEQYLQSTQQSYMTGENDRYFTGVSNDYKNTAGRMAYVLGQQLLGMGISAAIGPVSAAAEGGGLVGRLLDGETLGEAAKAALHGNVATCMIGLNTLGNTYGQLARSRGYDPIHYVNAVGQGFIEYFSEGLFGISDADSVQRLFSSASGSAGLNTGKALLNWLLSGGEEGLEELVNAPLSGGWDKLTVDREKKWFGRGGVFDLEEMVTSGVQGAVVGLILGAAGAVTGSYRSYQAGMGIQETAVCLNRVGQSLPQGYQVPPLDVTAATVWDIDRCTAQLLARCVQMESEAVQAARAGWGEAAEDAIAFPIDVDYTEIQEEMPYYLPADAVRMQENFDAAAAAARREVAVKQYGLAEGEDWGLQYYVQGMAYEWTKLQRDRQLEDLSDYEHFWLEQIENGLQKHPSYRGRTYRNLEFGLANEAPGAYQKFLFDHQLGKVVTLDALSSASKDPNGYPAYGGRSVHLVIDGCSGRDISGSYSLPAQQEVVYLPGTQLYIWKVEMANDGCPLIYAKEMGKNDLERDSANQGALAHDRGNQENAGREGHDLGGIHSDRGVPRGIPGGGAPSLYQPVSVYAEEHNGRNQSDHDSPERGLAVRELQEAHSLYRDLYSISGTDSRGNYGWGQALYGTGGEAGQVKGGLFGFPTVDEAMDWLEQFPLPVDRYLVYLSLRLGPGLHRSFCRQSLRFGRGLKHLPFRRRKLSIARPAACGRACSRRCASSPHATRCAGLARGPRWGEALAG